MTLAELMNSLTIATPEGENETERVGDEICVEQSKKHSEKYEMHPVIKYFPSSH